MKAKPKPKGIVGLQDTNNTSFINSIVQCLAQTPQLTQIFLNNDYQKDINKNNPLGYAGNIAKSYALLLKEIWSATNQTVSPSPVKDAIAQAACRFFARDTQLTQDASQFLSFLLNGLHQDLNRVLNKPFTESVEANGRDDDIVAKESWQLYRMRNDSIFVDTLFGQNKDEIQCPDCNKISIKFDPFKFLTLPFPTNKYKTIQYTWIDSDTSIPPTYYCQTMLKIADIDMLKEAIASSFYKKEMKLVKGYVRKTQRIVTELIPLELGNVIHKFYEHVRKVELFTCDVWKSKIYRELERHDSIADIKPKYDDIFVYHSLRPNLKEWELKQPEIDEDKAENQNQFNEKGEEKYDYQTFVVNNQHRVLSRQEYLHSTHSGYKDEPIGFPLLITFPRKIRVTLKSIGQELFKLIKPLMKNQNLTMDDELPFEFWAVWGSDEHRKILIVDSDEILDITMQNMKFIIHWSDATQYKSEYYTTTNRLRNMDKDSQPIDMSECIDVYCDTTRLTEDNAWYCSKCKDYKCATRKRDIWNCNDLLIIHLERFMMNRNSRDKIIALVKFPINGLDMGQYILSEDGKKDAIYDLCAVCNHEGGIGGDEHYTAFVRSLENKEWYYINNEVTKKSRK